MEDWLEKSLPFLTCFIQDWCENQLSEINVSICREDFFSLISCLLEIRGAGTRGSAREGEMN